MFIPSTPVSEIFGGHISRRNTTREGPFTGEDPLTGWGEDEHQGPAGPITFLRSRKLCVLHTSRMIDVRTDSSVQGQSLYIILYASDWLVFSERF